MRPQTRAAAIVLVALLALLVAALVVGRSSPSAVPSPSPIAAASPSKSSIPVPSPATASPSVSPSPTTHLPQSYVLPPECQYADGGKTDGSATTWQIKCPTGLPSNYLRPSLTAQGKL